MRWISERALKKWNIPVIDLLCLTVFWLLSLVVVHPAGNFPLDDDWSYGLTVKHLIETGSYQATGWESMTLIVNVLWGSVFCFVSGFSFTVLRCSTFVAAWLGMLAVYWLMRECRQSRGVTLLATLVFVFNPVYYVLSNTFMTDVLFITLSVLAAIFFLKDLKGQSNANLVLATALSLAAVMSRQVGLAVPLAFAMVSTLQHGGKARATGRAVLPLIVSVTALAGFEDWLARTGRLPALYNYKNEMLFQAISHPARFAGVFAHSSYLCLMYVGLYLSPILVFSLPLLRSKNKRGWLVCGLLVAGLVGLTVINGLCGKGYTMPLATNILNKSGLGPLTLRDAFKVNTTPILPENFWIAVTVVSVAGAVMLVSRIIKLGVGVSPKLFPFQLDPDEAGNLFLVLTGLVYLLPFFLNGFFDRYLFPAVPFLMAGLFIHLPESSPGTHPHPHVSPAGSVPANLTGALLLAGFIAFSVCGTRDYLAWNRARWMALNDLTQQDLVSPSTIDGGFEFNGYYLYRPDFKIDYKKSFWWVDDDAYLINFHPTTNYSVYRTYPYTHWMPPYTGTIYVLKRIAVDDLPNGKER
jgi:hypothetical protein